MNDYKRYCRNILFCLMAGILGLLSFIKANQGYPDLYIPRAGQPLPDKVDYKLEAPLTGLPHQAPVYKYKVAQITPNDATELAQKLGLQGSVEYDSLMKRYLVRDGQKQLELEAESGKWEYHDYAVWGNVELNKSIPSDEEAIRAAQTTLDRLGIKTANFNVRVVPQTAGGLMGNEKIVRKDVYLMRMLDGKPVYGVSRIIVSVGHQGEIEAICKFYHELEFDRAVELKNVEQAYTELKNKKASINIHPDAKTAVIKQIKLGYWEDAGPSSSQIYVQPVWVFRGDAYVNGEVEEFDAFVPAVEGVKIADIP